MSDEKGLAKESLLQQVASQALLQVPQKDIAKKLGVTEWKIRKLMESDEYRDLLKKLSDEATGDAKHFLKTRTKNAVPEVWDAMMSLIRSDSGKDKAEGIRSFFRLIGLDQTDKDTGPGNIQILLPGARTETVVDVTPKEGNDAES